ncbi:2-hydroxyacid dehydrogenase [Acerihabitans arboris]|uniref:D-glycerate dehydrogenase n=1 Tax=Acerihabitans arboris TaxID=2691583 RepID=A0A845SSN9_9GAMM|nr:D-glycerate dehydrogenase [Acerihabitans arboris]NDL64105.1 D-glycerate dehydrogenase [Acerihabitans arboris]
MSDKPVLFMACPLFAQAHALLSAHFTLRHTTENTLAGTLASLSAMADVEALLVTLAMPLDSQAIVRLPRSVKAICTYSVGTNHLDLAAAKKRGIKVLYTPNVLSESCADAALLLMLGASRRALEGLRLLKGGEWSGWAPDQLLGKDVWNQRLGIFGMGRIGQAIARRARGFDMEIHYHNRLRLPPAAEQKAIYHDSLAALAAHSDYFCIACPPTPETLGLVDAALLARLPEGAVVVNISRGDIVNDNALIAALNDGHVAAAGLDVYAGEPEIHPAYRQMDNVFGLPHLGSATLATRLRMAALLRDGLSSILAGKAAANVAN